MTAHALAYAFPGPDEVRRRFELRLVAEIVPALLAHSGGGRLLDLGCGTGAVADLAGPELDEYVGVDLRPPRGDRFVAADLRDGLGAVGAESFDLYLGTFGIASHLSPAELRALVGEIAAHGRAGSIVALEALGLWSLEWPGIWTAPPGDARLLPYRLGADVTVHPWGPGELGAIYESSGIEWLGSLDRTVQFGPKLGEGRYWPGMPDLRGALAAALNGERRDHTLLASLPPLPAHGAAAAHQELARRRRSALRNLVHPGAVARRAWALEPRSAAGLGHGLLAIGCVRG